MGVSECVKYVKEHAGMDAAVNTLEYDNTSHEVLGVVFSNVTVNDVNIPEGWGIVHVSVRDRVSFIGFKRIGTKN